MKKIAAFLIMGIMAFFAGAESLSLEGVTSALAKHPVTTGKFSQAKTLSSNGRTLKSSGNFVFCLEGVMWQTQKPFASGLAVTKTQIIQTAANGKQTVTDTSNNEVFKSVSGTIISIFSNDIQNIKSNFNTEFLDKGNDSWVLKLEPKDKTVSAVLKNMSLEGNSSAGESTILSLKMEETSGDIILYNFSEHNYPKELTADEKSFFTAK